MKLTRKVAAVRWLELTRIAKPINAEIKKLRAYLVTHGEKDADGVSVSKKTIGGGKVDWRALALAHHAALKLKTDPEVYAVERGFVTAPAERTYVSAGASAAPANAASANASAKAAA